MTAVKGSPQYRLKVVRDRPLLTWAGRLLWVCILAVATAASYYYGVFQGQRGAAVAAEEVGRLTVALTEAQTSEAQLRQQLANLELGARVDRQASEDVRQEVIDLKNQLAELQEENSFYRNLMAPSENQKGLNFGAVEISDTETPRQYRYKVVLQQLSTNHALLTGTLTFNVVGRREGEVLVLPLSELSDDVETVNIKLRFKYFQTVQGHLQLPPGFEPERIELVARSSGSNPITVEKRFGWLVQET